jgi:regulator of sirC expression with transglutaminase-like and TPR domain
MFRAALEDLERYLVLAPEAGDVDEIRHHVVELRKTVSRLN